MPFSLNRLHCRQKRPLATARRSTRALSRLTAEIAALSVLMTVRAKAARFRPETTVEQKAVLKHRTHQPGLSLVYSSPAEQCAGEGCGTIMCMVMDSFMKME